MQIWVYFSEGTDFVDAAIVVDLFVSYALGGVSGVASFITTDAFSRAGYASWVLF